MFAKSVLSRGSKPADESVCTLSYIHCVEPSFYFIIMLYIDMLSIID